MRTRLLWLLGGASLAAAAPETTVTRLPLQQERLAPVVWLATGPGAYFADFGRASYGGLELTVDSPTAGGRVTLRLGEALSAPHTLNRKPGGSVRFHSAEVELRAGRHTYTVPLTRADARLMPTAIGPVMPFRYVELEHAPALDAASLRQVAVSYPFNAQASDFKCADPRLNAVWELCKHSLKMTSFGGVFVDGDRERKPYEADAYINQLGWYCCTDDWTLPRYTHEYLIAHPTWPTEWILFSVLMAWEDYRYTGDPTSLNAYYEDLKAKTLLALARPDGLISTVEPPFPVKEFAQRVGTSIHINHLRDIVDWPAGERDGCELKPVNTVVNAFHCRALGLMARLAEVRRQSADAERFRAAAATATASLNARLVDPATGLYVDGEGSRHSSLHANMFPLAFGLVPAERRAAVVEFVRGRKMACSVYGAQFLLDALFEAGRADDALALLTSDGPRGWLHMLELGSTVTLEAWDPRFKPNLDWNHAWGAAPANVLPRWVLGIEPLAPGFKQIRIQPRPGKLAWAEGHVTTVAGQVGVRWEQAADGLHVRVDVPAGCTARVGTESVGAGRHEVVCR